MSIETLKQALETLEMLARYENPETRIQVRKPKDGGPIVTMYPHKVATDAANALRTAIEQAEKQEPVAWNAGVPPLYPEIKDGETISVEYTTPFAAPVQEPVAWCVLEPWLSGKFEAQDCFSDVALDANVGWVPLYTTPPAAQRQWVGLTEWEREELRYKADDADTGYMQLIKDTEAKLREKNTGDTK